MSLLPITLYGDKILRKKVDKVSDVDIETIELISNMFDTMRNANGIGLAANQVGANKSIFVVDVSKVEGYEEIKPVVFINPVIEKYFEEQVMFEEGCLSIPDVHGEVERPESVLIKYYDTDLRVQTLEADKLFARVIQHEFDHLQGILFTDLVDDETKNSLKKPLQKIKKRKIDVSYPVSETIDYQLL